MEWNADFLFAGERHRDNMFMICSGALITAAAAVGTLLSG
jgi:hypothetical protein